MKYTRYKNTQTYNNHYQPNNSDTNGQGSYLGKEMRSIINNFFRNTKLVHNPKLHQSLPAKQQEALANNPEIVAIHTELVDLREQEDSTAASRRDTLHREHQKVFNKALRTWQKSQPTRLLKTGQGPPPPPCYH